MVVFKVSDRAELLARVGKFEGETVEQIDINLTYTWTTAQGVDNGGTIINVGTGSWVASNHISKKIGKMLMNANNTDINNRMETSLYDGKGAVPDDGGTGVHYSDGEIFYVSSSNGSDSNDGLSPARPFKTVQDRQKSCY